MSDCLFCKIVADEVPAEVVHVTERTVAFRDINPQAPTHVLVIPKRHEPDVASLAAADPEATVDLITHTRRIADELGTGVLGQQLRFLTELARVVREPLSS